MKYGKLVLGIMLLSVVLTSCASSPAYAPPNEPIYLPDLTFTETPTPLIGEQVWSTDDCLYTFTGLEWERAGYCREWDSQTSFTIWSTTNPPIKYMWVRDHDPDYIYYFDYEQNLEMAMERKTSIKYVNTSTGWIDFNQYYQAKSAEATKQALEAITRSNQATEEALRLQVEIMTIENQNRINRILLSPPCASSAWGCDP
jgi:hypothetical protein